MLHKIFTVYDSKSEVYSKPFMLKTKGEAMRGFVDVSNDKESAIGQHPEDYSLFEIGEFDDGSANIVNHDANVSLGVAIEFVN